MSRVLLFVLILSLCHASAFAAFKSQSEAVSLKETINPKEAADDIILPMPCGLSMVFKAVNVPSNAIIRDKSFYMGIANDLNPDRKLYEKQFSGHIAGSFTNDDLPKAWRDKIKAGANGDTWYFIGKYEVSRLQWEAVMRALNEAGEEDAAACPAPGKGSNLPVAGISWFDAQQFINKYNAWLIKNHDAELPRFTGTNNIAFIRLPTEEEWEYAARGGANVPREWWEDQDIFPLDKDKTLKDYGVYNQGVALKEPAPIGSRNANPLDLYDTVGNVREMVDGFFRMSIADMRNGAVERRLHGSAGGILAKGGSFRSPEYDVLPGYRDEIPLYTLNGQSRPNDLGFRLALAGLNIPDSQRLDTLRAEEKKAVSEENKEEKPRKAAAPEKSAKDEKPIQLGAKLTPLEAVDALSAQSGERLKAGLAQLKSMLEDQEEARAAQDSKNLENIFKALLYQTETLRAIAMRNAVSNTTKKQVISRMKNRLSPAEMEHGRKILKETEEEMEDYRHSIQMGANYYRLNLNLMAASPANEIDRLVSQAQTEYGAQGADFNKRIRQNIDNIKQFVKIIREKGNAALPTKTLLKQIIPPRHFEALKIGQ